MWYKDLKVLDINPVVYLGDEFKYNGLFNNMRFFRKELEKLNFKTEIYYECPVYDLILVHLDYDDDLILFAKDTTIELILTTANELLKIFKDVKISLYVDSVGDADNVIDLTIKEFVEWLQSETHTKLN